MREPQNKFVRPRRAGSLDDFGPGGLRRPIGNVFGNSSKKQKRLLEDEANIAPVIGQGVPANIDAIDQNGSLRDVMEATNEINQRALARTAVPHQANHLTRRNVQVDAPNDRAVSVTKTDAPNLNTPRESSVLIAARKGVDRIRNTRDMIENVENPLGTRRSLLG